jgi:hypothetical protein
MKLARLHFLLILLLTIACSSEKFIEGRVVDFDTGQALVEVQVVANQQGWGLSDINNDVVWDKTFPFQAITDEKGNFHILYDVGDSAHIWTLKEGYSQFVHWYPENSQVVIKLKKKDPDYVPPQQQLAEIGFKQSRPYGWVFAENRRTFDADEADLFPLVSGEQKFLRYDVVVQSSMKGGLQFISATELGVPSDWMIFADEVPEGPWKTSVRLETKSDEPGGVYFVRTRDGFSYAKFEFNPRSFGAQGSEREFKEGTWGLLLNAVYSDSGSRLLKVER